MESKNVGGGWCGRFAWKPRRSADLQTIVGNGFEMSSCAGGEQRAYDGSALQRKALTAEEAKVKNREKAKRSADKKKEAHAAALEEADGLITRPCGS